MLCGELQDYDVEWDEEGLEASLRFGPKVYQRVKLWRGTDYEVLIGNITLRNRILWVELYDYDVGQYEKDEW